MSQADDIRQFVIANQIAPARERGVKTVAIRAGDVHHEMKLNNAMPAVCSAIGSQKFWHDAGVREVSKTGPSNSSNLVITFALEEASLFGVAEAETVLKNRYGNPSVDTAKMVSFDLPDGSAIALQRDIAKVQLWLEDDGRVDIPAVEDMERYAADRGRHSNLPDRLNDKPSLELRKQGFPKKVVSLRVRNNGELQNVLDWYEQKIGSKEDGKPKMVQGKSPAVTSAPTNLILFGPPGTGKTYATISEAVALCDGSSPNYGTRQALMSRYSALKEAGRIAFVTFHQSYSYEDFVEGLRPETGVEEDGSEVSLGGFRLKPIAGIFKRIATLAEQASVSWPNAIKLDLTDRNFFKMSLGRAFEQSEIYQGAIAGNYIALGWGGEIDWSDPAYEKRDAILAKWRSIKPDISANAGDVSQTFRLRATMREGDIVIISDGNSLFRAIGEIVGPYEYVADADDYRHRRKVRWLRVLEKSLPVDTILDGKFTQMALYLIDPTKVKRAALETILGADTKSQGGEPARQPDPYVLIIDEINRANISKVFGELITLIEPDKRLGQENALTATLPYSNETFGVPANLHIIGTMNTADRSIALLDTALRRRFEFRELMPQSDLLPQNVDGIDLRGLLTTLNGRIEYVFDREHQIGHAYFMGCTTKKEIDSVMRTRIIPLLAEYFYENWEKIRQVLGETTDEGGFIIRTKLNPPKGGDDDFGNERWRFTVREHFEIKAYSQLTP